MMSHFIYLSVAMYCAQYMKAQQLPAGIDSETFAQFFDPDNLDAELTTPDDMERFSPTPGLDISPEQIRQSLYVLKGGLTEHVDFHYQNHQNMQFNETGPRGAGGEEGQGGLFPFGYNCTMQYLKCLISHSVHSPVCSFNNPQKDWREYNQMSGYFTGVSYCDIYYDNCRIGFRAWRILAHGICNFVYQDWRDDVIKGRRMQTKDNPKKKYIIISKISNAIAIRKGDMETVHKYN